MGMNQISGQFVDASGTPVANGSLTFRLTADAKTLAQVCAGIVTKTTLDSNGNITSFSLWPTDQMPAGSVYSATLYSADGQTLLSGDYKILSSPTPFNLSQGKL